MATTSLPVLSPEAILSVDSALEAGASRDRAVRAAGISDREYRVMQRLAAQGAEPYASWVQGMEVREAELEKKLTQKVLNAGDWKSAMRMLESKFPKEWAQKIQVEVTRELDHVYAIAEKTLPPEQFDRLLAAIGSASQGEDGFEADDVGLGMH